MRGKSITVASVIGPHTVTSEPTWSWTSLMQVNWSAHIRLQLKSRNHDCHDFTSTPSEREMSFHPFRIEHAALSAQEEGVV